MSEIHAVIGWNQTKHLVEFVQKRNKIMDLYDNNLATSSKFHSVKRLNGMIPSGYKYILEFGSQKACNLVKMRLKNEYGINLGGGVYDIPIHKQPVFQQMFKGEVFPQAEKFCASHLCLPIWSTMQKREIEYVIECFQRVVKDI